MKKYKITEKEKERKIEEKNKPFFYNFVKFVFGFICSKPFLCTSVLLGDCFFQTSHKMLLINMHRGGSVENIIN